MRRARPLLLLILAVSACSQEPPRQNPLIPADATEVGNWIVEWGRTKDNHEALDACADYWSTGSSADIPTEQAPTCQNVSDLLATALSEGGYGDVHASDVVLPPIWAAYIKRRVTAAFGKRNRTPEEEAERRRAFEALGIEPE